MGYRDFFGQPLRIDDSALIFIRPRRPQGQSAYCITALAPGSGRRGLMLTSPLKPQLDRSQILQSASLLGVLGAAAGTAPRLLALLCSVTAGADETAQLIEKHPVLCARVLRVANSPYYGQARSITTLKRAVLLLGLDAVRGIAAAACLDRTMSAGVPGNLLDLGLLLRHSLATAIAAASLAHVRAPSLAPEAFIAGLLHNLGVIVQAHIDSPGFAAMLEARRSDTSSNIRRLEFEHAAVPHEDCTAVIFDAWQLPDSLVAAAGHHHQPHAAPAPYRQFAALVNLGAGLGLACGYTFALEPAFNGWDVRAMDLLRLEPADMERLAAELPPRVEDLHHALAQT